MLFRSLRTVLKAKATETGKAMAAILPKSKVPKAAAQSTGSPVSRQAQVSHSFSSVAPIAEGKKYSSPYFTTSSLSFVFTFLK